MAGKQKKNPQLSERAEYPFLLPPSVGNVDPTPLLTTLARVAVAVARRRSEALRRDDNSKQIGESS